MKPNKDAKYLVNLHNNRSNIETQCQVYISMTVAWSITNNHGITIDSLNSVALMVRSMDNVINLSSIIY